MPMMQEVRPSENDILQIFFFLSLMLTFLKQNTVLCMPFIFPEPQKFSALLVLSKENVMLLSTPCHVSLMYLLANGNTKILERSPISPLPHTINNMGKRRAVNKEDE